MATKEEMARTDYFFQMYVTAMRDKNKDILTGVFGYDSTQVDNFQDDENWHYEDYALNQVITGMRLKTLLSSGPFILCQIKRKLIREN